MSRTRQRRTRSKRGGGLRQMIFGTPEQRLKNKCGAHNSNIGTDDSCKAEAGCMLENSKCVPAVYRVGGRKSRKHRKSTKKGMRRKTARRAYIKHKKTRKHGKSRKYRKH